MKIRLLGDLLLIKRADSVRQVGSIMLADSAVEELQEGEVIAVGPGKLIERSVAGGTMQERRHWTPRPMDVAVGDRVLFSKHGHQIVKIDGEEFVTLHEDSIIGVRTSYAEMAKDYWRAERPALDNV